MITELMAECLRQRYISPAYIQVSSERSQALKRKAPNLSNHENPGTAGIFNKKMQRCHSGTDTEVNDEQLNVTVTVYGVSLVILVEAFIACIITIDRWELTANGQDHA